MVNRSMGGGIETHIEASDGSIVSRGRVMSLIGTVDHHASVGDGVDTGRKAMVMLFVVVVEIMDCVDSGIGPSQMRARAKFMD